jgi:hypothetical protein
MPAPASPDSPVGPVGSPSPQASEGETENDDSRRIETTSPRTLTPSLPKSNKKTSLKDLVIEAVQTLTQLCKYPHGLPSEVYSGIVLTLGSNPEEVNTASSADWSDGTVWMGLLAAGEARKSRNTAWNMLEYMGAWAWYDRQIELAKTKVHTRRKKLVSHRGAAMHVLNKLQALEFESESEGKAMQGVGRLTIGEKAPGISEHRHTSTDERARDLQRKSLETMFHRGKTLKETLVAELGSGILLSSKIW